MYITLDDVACLLYLLIKGRLQNYLRISRILLGDAGEAEQELDATRGAHAWFSYLDGLYKSNSVASVEAESDDKNVLFHIQYALRSYFIYLVDTTIFMDISLTYVDVVYVTYFTDLERIYEYN